MSKQYKLKDYYRPSPNEQTLLKKYKTLADQNQKASIMQQIQSLRGLYTDKNGILCVSPRDFVLYLLASFKVLVIADSVAFYNWNKHEYEYLSESVYLSFFKKILDQVGNSVWCGQLEGAYKKRFLRDIKVSLREQVVPEGIVVFNNGYLEVDTGVFSQGDYPDKIFNFSCTGYDYDAEATCPMFTNFIQDIFNNDSDLINVFQEVGGYTFCYGANPLQIIVILIGRGRNGKGVVCNLMQKLHGVENCSATSVSKLSETFGLANMSDKVLNISNENDENVYTDTSVMKNISGNDIVLVEKKFKDAIPTRIFCKLWIATNDILFKDSSKGFEERLVPIPFKNTYVMNPQEGTNERQGDPDLENKLTSELPGIFLWFYEGYVRLKANNWKLSACEEIMIQRRKFVEDSNPVQLFVNMKVTKVVGGRTKKPDTYRRFKEWTSANNIPTGPFVSAQRFYPKFEACLSNMGYPTSTKRIQGFDYYPDIDISMGNDL